MALPVLMWFTLISFVTKDAVNASSTFSNRASNSRNSLRTPHMKSKNPILNDELQNGRFLQTYTNETADYESGPAVNQDRAVDFEYCYSALQRADSNNKGRLETVDYLSFVQDFGSNTECLGDIMSLPVMPIELTACWNQLSCECRNRGGAPDCCEKENAHLPLSGINADAPAPSALTSPQPPQESYIQQEQDFLMQTCLRTDQCIISYCGYPPPPLPIIPPVLPTTPPIVPPIVPTIPTTTPPVTEPKGLVQETNYWWFLLLLLLLCCCRRRWILCPAGKDDEEEDDEEEGDEEEGNEEKGDEDDLEQAPFDPGSGADFEGDHNDPDANRMAMKSMAATAVGVGGGVRYYRVVQEPEYEEPPPPPEPKVIDQYDKGLQEGSDMELKHIEKSEPPPPEEDPHALEHYEPDGGIVEHERKGEWSYSAEGGYTEEERAAKEGSEWNRPGYERAAVAAAVAADDRRDRNLDKYGGGAIFDHLDETDEPPTTGGASNSLEWVFSKTLNTLDDNEDDLRSDPSSSSSRSLLS
eukprot:CAMPEP_0172400076 /NCGR_PEP_ID=MMETSP1061-20121228/44015_1 /TAXON_ID=37318 /ORGANISM="Pseudo-nitzschia pungens, Strain cf. pungens" /LENGTH=526 /DNA_ID=CAMNT_0013133183 /DNA_START=296 /DNA_END=1876 /DNA_ORIENTATION=+